MENERLYRGYNPEFLVDDLIRDIVNLPSLGDKHVKDLAPVEGSQSHTLNYLNYSVQLSATRKFPIFTATNIDGRLFKKASRAKSWKKDKRAKPYQWGLELYRSDKSDFDRGHMTKREDVQWGDTIGLAQKAADSTFYYSNAVPQHRDLNQQIWRSLEDYILHTETKKNSLKVSVFTGPVLSNSDPVFVTQVKGESVLIPFIFWKVVFYPKPDGQLCRVGFIMSQKRLLIDNGIVEELELAAPGDDVFMQFSDAATYQVNVNLIEKLADLKFHSAVDSYKDTRSMKLVLKEIDIEPDLESISIEQTMGFSISNLTL